MKPTFNPIVYAQGPDQLDASFNPKNATQKKAKIITPPSIGQLEKRASTRATDVVLTLNFGCNGNHLYFHRFKPLREACVPESTSAATYVIRVRGCRMTKIQQQRHAMQTQQDVLSSDSLAAQKRLR